MAKGFFFSLPSVSVNKTLLPVIDQLCDARHEISYYNTPDFENRIGYKGTFKAYPDYSTGYRTDRIDSNISYFQFADILLDTALSLMDFIRAEIERERPDFILHSHLAPWGKLAARYFNLPAVSLFSTFILDEQIMVPYFKKNKYGNTATNISHVNDALNLYRKLLALHAQLQLKEKPDIWDLYVNKESLNLSFISAAFQPQPEVLGPGYNFVGFPMEMQEEKKDHGIIYVSMGTVQNKDSALFNMIIDVLRDFDIRCVISIGSSVEVAQLVNVPSHIQLSAFVDQVAMLKQASIFITRGGMASVQEALCTLTPMIVIPEIPEQHLTAENIEQLGIGIQITEQSLYPVLLKSAIGEILSHHEQYVSALKTITMSMGSTSPCNTAVALINTYLNTCSCN